MKKTYIILISVLILAACKQTVTIDTARIEILQTEKAFEKMVSEKGMAEAFYYFADENAVIRRGNDSLIIGKENIRYYYDKNTRPNAKLSWTPDFIGVSDCGTLGYTYGKFVFSIQDTSGKTIDQSGIFHTVWKKQNKEWRYVWD
jgi:ketosteroid isomerase-like protein